MKLNFKSLLPPLLIPALLIVVFTPVFGAISDATGLVNRFDIETGGQKFEIVTTANFDVQKVEFDKDQKQLTFLIVSSLDKNLGEVIIPRNLLSGNFTFFLNGHDFQPKIKTNDKISFITLNFTGKGNNKLEMFATNYLEDLELIDPVDSNKSEVIEQDSKENTPGGGCLIATATFGSELSDEVQSLRELRDTKILKTKIGSNFMDSFNNFYYSFSPFVADLERENPAFKEGVKIVITPMLFSLSLLDKADMDSEIEVAGYGLGIIFLNIGMYFAAPAIIIMRFQRR